MPDVETDYARMTESERARFEEEHFDRLNAQDKFRVANQQFSSGRAMVGEKAVIIDHAYGNGDGVWDKTDQKILEEKRNDMGLLNGIAKAGETMFTAAAISTGHAALVAPDSSFQLGVGGLLRSTFGTHASGAPQATASLGHQPAPTGSSLFSKLTHAVGLG